MADRRERMSRKLVLSIAAVVVFAASGVAAYARVASAPIMGPMSTLPQEAFKGFYDGHHVTYLSTDASTKAAAKAMHINYSASIGRVKGLPEIYLVQGRAAPGQLAVFGSEPGEPDYSPLWTETILNWKAGAKTVVIKSDTQVNAIEKTGKLTEHPGHIVLNCPIIKVSKS
jgi:hypothetical protein